MPVDSERQLVSLSAAADFVGVHPKTVRRWIDEGRVTGYRLGPRLIRLDMAELEQVLLPVANTDD